MSHPLFSFCRSHHRTSCGLAALVLSLALSACHPRAVMREATERIAPDDDEALAMQCLTALRTRDIDAVTKLLDPPLVTGDLKSQLETMVAVVAQGEPIAIELVGCSVNSRLDHRRTSLTYQFEFANAWTLAEVVVDTRNADKKIVGLHARSLPQSLGGINAFTFSGKGAGHYAILALAVAIPVLIVFALITCIRTPALKRKWLWILFIVIGVGKVGFNWTTGQLLFNPLLITVQLFAVSVTRHGLYAPWFIGLSLPLGAIVFLILRQRLARRAPPPLPETSTAMSQPPTLPPA